MRPLAVVGNVNVDLIMGPTAPWPHPGTELLVDHDELRIGGAAGNASLAWTGLGVPHQVAANTGADAFGEWLRNGFPGLSERWSRADARTTISVGLTHPDGERTFFTTRGHLAALTWPEARDSLDTARLSGGILLVCGSFVTEGLVGSYHAIFDWADANGIDVALDTGWPPSGWTAEVVANTKTWVARSRHLLLNSIETAALTNTDDFRNASAALDALVPDGATIVVKQGSMGAAARRKGGDWISCQAPSVAVLDTIGAGDVFDAGYLHKIAEGRPLGEALAAGVATASTAISTSPRRFSGPA